jgi:capsular polysaccharide biosynthesis protein
MERSMLTEDLTTFNFDSISLLPGYGHDNYSHFIYDRLPLLSHLKDDNCTILVEFEQKKYIEQLRKYFKNDFVYLQPKKNYLIKSVQLIANHIHPANYFPKCYLDFYKDLSFRIIPTDKKLPSFFYIYRPKGRRGILNEEEFHSYLVKHGFAIIRLENYSIDEQINIFMNAKFIIGVHGAGLTNVVFSKPGTKVIEIIPKSYFIDCFLVAASRQGLNYHRFYEDDTDIISSSGDLKFNDSFIDINSFDIFLRKIFLLNS